MVTTRNVGQWLAAVLSIKGESDAMTVPAAVEVIRATPPERRSAYAVEIWRKRRERGDRPGNPTGVATLERRARRRDIGVADPVRCGIPSSDQSLPRGRWL